MNMHACMYEFMTIVWAWPSSEYGIKDKLYSQSFQKREDLVVWRTSPFAREEGSGVMPIGKLTNQMSDLLFNNLLGLSLWFTLTNQVLDCHECDFAHTIPRNSKYCVKCWNNSFIDMTLDPSSLAKGLARQTNWGYIATPSPICPCYQHSIQAH
jgi:hypothetical protein